MSRRLRTVHLLTSLNAGGIAAFVSELLPALTAHGVDSHAVVTLAQGAYYDVLRSHGVEVHQCSLRWSTQVSWSYRVGKLIRNSAAYSFGPRLSWLLRRLRPDVVHSHIHGEHWVSQLAAAKAASARFVMQLHSPSSLYPASRQGRTLFPKLFGKHDRFIFPSRGVFAAYTDLLQPLGPQVVKMPYGIPAPSVEAYEPHKLRQRLGIPADAIIIGSVGRMLKMKRYEDLLAAMQQLRPHNLPLHVVLVGAGSHQAALKMLTQQLGLDDCVHFLGYQVDQHEWFNLFDIFVLSSLFEGFPIGVIEAMAHGLPMVGTDVSGTQDAIVHEQNGLLVPVQSPDALAAALLRFVRSPELRHQLGIAARQTFLENYEANRCAEQYAALYRTMVAA